MTKELCLLFIFASLHKTMLYLILYCNILNHQNGIKEFQK